MSDERHRDKEILSEINSLLLGVCDAQTHLHIFAWLKDVAAKLAELEGPAAEELKEAVRVAAADVCLECGSSWDGHFQKAKAIILRAVQPFCGETSLELKGAINLWKFAAEDQSKQNKELQADNATKEKRIKELNKQIKTERERCSHLTKPNFPDAG